jgi:hypothetical protein
VYAVQLPPTPPGQIEARTLNTNARSHLGREVTVDVLVARVNMTGYGDGPVLVALDRNHTRLARLDFVLDRPMADRLVALGVGGSPIAARVRGTVRDAVPAKASRLVMVDEVHLLAVDGGVAATVRRGEPTAPPTPAPADPVGFPAADPPGWPAAPPAVTEPDVVVEQVPPARNGGRSGTGMIVALILGGGLVLLLLGGGLVWLLMSMDTKKPARRGRGRRRYRDDYDD